MIKHWQKTYFEYLTHNGVDSSKHEEFWDLRTQDLIEMWEKMESGELTQIYKSFANFLQVHVDYYERINDNYRRDKGKKPFKVVPSNGGRYWL